MSTQSTSRLKLNPQLGRMPTLQFCRPTELRIDPAYQRDVTNGPSQSLIRTIAQHWNWDLCQPLVVARRTDFTERLFVIDGQHRLEAARLRGDIDQLPCVIVGYASAADEAASFVHLNQHRRPLTKIDLFKAALVSGDREACAIMAAMTAAGLSVAPHSNYTAWKPGMVQNIAGIEKSWRQHGAAVTETALRILSQAWAGQVLQYAGTAFPGIAAVCADEMPIEKGERRPLGDDRFEKLVVLIGERSQADWRRDMMQARAVDSNLNTRAAIALVVRHAWNLRNGIDPAPPPVEPARVAPARRTPPPAMPAGPFTGTRWCNQCDMKISHAQLQTCRSRWCSLRATA